MGELCRILNKGNSKFIDEIKKRWEDFCGKVQFYTVWKKVMKPPMSLDGDILHIAGSVGRSSEGLNSNLFLRKAQPVTGMAATALREPQ
ncbi:hypothetical protein HF521_011743 [Silurus meridionalis]|uniref:Uncharacterized protein n=1 Tax=Silurus meridionalis TaxID=175797 RepID=A0A8T0AIN5_SILME|nr:hypothetical protein HF521_011743 [Silurus meridionalis]